MVGITYLSLHEVKVDLCLSTRPLMWGCPPHAFVFRGFVIVVDATVDDNYVAFSKLIVDFPFVCNLNE